MENEHVVGELLHQRHVVLDDDDAEPERWRAQRMTSMTRWVSSDESPPLGSSSSRSRGSPIRAIASSRT